MGWVENFPNQYKQGCWSAISLTGKHQFIRSKIKTNLSITEHSKDIEFQINQFFIVDFPKKKYLGIRLL